MGGAGFPTHVKLSPKDPQKIEYVLVNGTDASLTLPVITEECWKNLKRLLQVLK